MVSLLVAAAAAAGLAACSSDDSSPSGGGGSGGSAGNAAAGAGHSGSGGVSASAGTGGKASGGSSGASAGSGGASAGTGGASGGTGGGVVGGGAGAGEGGAAGAVGEGGGGGEVTPTPCGPALTPPTVASTIAVKASAVLVAAYAAEGTQTYTCQVTGTGDTAVYAWSTASVPAATLYGSDCMIAATHYFVTPSPHWKANDGSIIAGTKVRSVGSDTAASIPQLLLSAAIDGGSAGIFTPVTAVQRLNTVGGIAPSTGCDAEHLNGTVAVPYTATYYFYSGTDIIPPA